MTECVARLAQGVAELPRDQWDACAGDANPFMSWDFLTALERSGSVGGHSGWQPLPLVIDGPDGRIAAAAPLYGKTHRSEEHTSELQSLMRISYAVFCWKKKKPTVNKKTDHNTNARNACLNI